MFTRWVQRRVQSLLEGFPVVFLQGARQVGKTTLAQQLIQQGLLSRYYTMDDPLIYASASQDPMGFAESLPAGSVLDEVQRVPELFRVLKMRVDAHRQSGMFLLTGSANPLTVPKVSESLAGRMAIATLYPLSQGEIEGQQEEWLQRVFSGETSVSSQPEPMGLGLRLLRGGYPSVVELGAEARSEWYRAYLATLLTRDVQQIADVERLVEFPRLLQLLATLSTRLLNVASLSRETGIPQTTLQRYLALLETLFLIYRIPAWYANLGKRLLKTPKILLNDTGLCAYLLNANEERIEQDPLLRGQLVETFVGLEILKKIEFTGHRMSLFHLRTDKGLEMDYVLENASGELVGVEVKASRTLTKSDFKSLEAFREMVGERFVAGVVLYLGSETLPFGQRLWAQPLSALWS